MAGSGGGGGGAVWATAVERGCEVFGGFMVWVDWSDGGYMYFFLLLGDYRLLVKKTVRVMGCDSVCLWLHVPTACSYRERKQVQLHDRVDGWWNILV